METVTISPKFQVVIPKGIRALLRLRPGQKVQAIALGRARPGCCPTLRGSWAADGRQRHAGHGPGVGRTTVDSGLRTSMVSLVFVSSRSQAAGSRSALRGAI
jgi:AbrB family looped-hinge helix DNA binding protein